MLHTVNKSPFQSNLLDTCIKFASKDEPILLMEDAVYGAQSGTSLENKIKDLMKSNPVYVLQADLKARGIDKIIDGITTVDYGGFVDLTTEHKVNNWL